MAFIASKGIEWVRSERARRLADCDWTQSGDSPLDPPLRFAWGKYRQELRDMDLNPPVDWPLEPTEGQTQVSETTVTLSTRLEDYRNDGETNDEMQHRILDELSRLMSKIVDKSATQKERAEHSRLHALSYELKEAVA